jgi:hypothetical protein
MEKFVIDGYLTEQALGKFLQYAFPETKISGYVNRDIYGFSFELCDTTYVVRYLDEELFINPYKTAESYQSDFELSSQGIVCINIPFFIQLNMDSLHFIFGYELGEMMVESGVMVECDAPHGFDADRNKTTLPFTFSAAGLELFMNIIYTRSGLNQSEDIQDTWSIGRKIQYSLWNILDDYSQDIEGSRFCNCVIQTQPERFRGFLEHEYT